MGVNKEVKNGKGSLLQGAGKGAGKGSRNVAGKHSGEVSLESSYQPYESTFKDLFARGAIRVVGAREHNLKNINVSIPKNKITVMTGLSGSGKSSLAFDTIYAEGQRRYIESLSHYARHFLEQLKKPDLDSITGLSPAIAIDQKSVSSSPRSTVGTVTEIYDFLRLLFARLGTPYCPDHDLPVVSQTREQILADIKLLKEGSKFLILARVAESKKGEFQIEIQKWIRSGIVKARIDGNFLELDRVKKLAKTKPHTIDLVVDQLILKESLFSRLEASVKRALDWGGGSLILEIPGKEAKVYSQKASCPVCSFGFLELDPRLFSFNNPRGACSVCGGLGTEDLIEIRDYQDNRDGDARALKKVRYEVKNSHSSKGAAGNSKSSRGLDGEEDLDADDMWQGQCSGCGGMRLNKRALAVKIKQQNIFTLGEFSAEALYDFFSELRFDEREVRIAGPIIKEIKGRLDYLRRVGLGYLSLNRGSRTLSGGEAQRIRLASQLGSALVGVLYVMDEPSIGLHARDHAKLLEIIKELRDRGNTVVLVEHDEDTIRAADFVVDLGPRAGVLGGEVMGYGSPDFIAENGRGLTSDYLSKRKSIAFLGEPRIGRNSEKRIRIEGASGNNLRNISVDIPLGRLVAVTGVSGSGKSTLIVDTLYKNLANRFHQAGFRPAPCRAVFGMEHVDRVIEINQKPIGRTPRSTPATYVDLFPLIRQLFASMPEAGIRGFTPSRFSFNLKGGRCEACSGQGQVRIEMNFLSDVFVECEVCRGRRYNAETLGVHFRGKSIYDVLAMSVEEALDFFKHHKLLQRKLETLHRVGLDYLTLAQSSTTLSGGEAQRIKLARELSKRATGRTIYILDEPTTGLHFEDVRKLIELLNELVEQGNTVLVIEHNLELIKGADWIIDLGPDGGVAGGVVVQEGSPSDFVRTPRGATAEFLRRTM